MKLNVRKNLRTASFILKFTDFCKKIKNIYMCLSVLISGVVVAIISASSVLFEQTFDGFSSSKIS